MADADNSTPAPAPVAAPVAAAPVSAPAASTPAPAPSVSSAPVEAAPAVVPAGEPVPAAVASEIPSLLGKEADVKPEVTPEAPQEGEKKTEEAPQDAKEGEKPKDGETPAEGEVQAETSAELPKFEPFKLPEGMTANEQALSEFTGLLGKLEIAKGDHKSVQEIGQTMVEMFNTQMSDALKKQTDFYVSLHEKTKASEFESLRNDPSIAGGDEKKFEQYGRDMANFLQRNGGTKEEVTSFRKFVDERGVANALPLVKLLHNLKSKIDKYESEVSPIVAGTKPATEKSAPGKGIMQALYGGSKK